MRLSDYARNTFSQFGEDGMIDHIFSKIGVGDGVCVEFGAADGTSCSNTRRLWDDKGWRAVLIEPTPSLFNELKLNTYLMPCELVNDFVTPTGERSIDAVLHRLGIPAVDFMSIDVDGPDYLIWQAMQIRPRVVCIEYNVSIPPGFSVYQKDFHDSLGASATALIDLAKDKAYKFVGLTKGNLFFVTRDYSYQFNYYECHLESLFPYEELAYLGTDYRGRPFIINKPPWGVAELPYAGTAKNIHYVGPRLDLIRTIEADFGETALVLGQDFEVTPAAWTPQGDSAYRRLFNKQAPLIVIDIANLNPCTSYEWVTSIGTQFGYDHYFIGSLLLVFTKEIDEP